MYLQASSLQSGSSSAKKRLAFADQASVQVAVAEPGTQPRVRCVLFLVSSCTFMIVAGVDSMII